MNYTGNKPLTAKEKIDALVDRFSKNRAHFAEQIGMTPQAVNNWLYRNSIPKKGLLAIQDRFPQVSEEWLFGKLATEQDTETMMVNDFHVSCGDAPAFEQSEGMVPASLPIPGVKFLFPCSGNSMEPKIYDGDYVGVGEQMNRFESFKKDCFYLVLTDDGRAMVKGVIDPGPDCPYLQLTTVNPDYKLENEGRLMKSEFRTAYKVNIIINKV